MTQSDNDRSDIQGGDQNAPGQTGARRSGDTADTQWARSSGAREEGTSPEAGEVRAYGNMGTMSGFGDNEKPATSAGTQRPDNRIREEVIWLLSNEALIDADSLQVRVEGGVVTLQGYVTHPQARQMAEDRASMIAGVTGTQNQLQVRREVSGS
jgi:BON domain-containing protein